MLKKSNPDNMLSKKCEPYGTAAVVFEYFIRVSTCHTCNSGVKIFSGAKVDVTKYNLVPSHRRSELINHDSLTPDRRSERITDQEDNGTNCIEYRIIC